MSLKESNAMTLRKQVLFVDDDPQFLETVGKLFEQLSNESWEIHLATQTAEAIEMLDHHKIDLAIIDMQMPVVDGTQLIGLLHRKDPKLPKVALTGHAKEEGRTACLQRGANLYLEKPTSAEGYRDVFAVLNELAAQHSQEGFQGLVRQVGLADVLQMECLARNSSVLRLVTDQGEGSIFIENGNIIHAEVNDRAGVEAFNCLLGLKGGHFSIQVFHPPAQNTIEGQWESLVMEAARKRDEEAAENPEPDPPPNPASSRPSPVFTPVVPDSPEESADRKIEEVVVCSGRGEVWHSWQCRDIDSRLKLIELIAQRSNMISEKLGLGRLDRLEVDGPHGRAITHFQSDRNVWVRAVPSQPVIDLASPNATSEDAWGNAE